jgi:hypothetical protein
MGVIIGATDALTGDYYSTWGKLRAPILGQDIGPWYGAAGTHTIEYLAGGGFLTDNDTPIRFDMRYDSTTWPFGFWRPNIYIVQSFTASPTGWYVALLFINGNVTLEDEAELTGETVVGTGGSFVINSDFFDNGQYLAPLGPPQPIDYPIFSVGKLNAF